MKPLIVGANYLSEAFGVTKRQAANYADQGMPRHNRGRYDFVQAVKWYVAYREAEYQKRLAGLDLEEQETRLKRAQASMKELQLVELQGALVRRAAVEQAWERQIGAAKVRLLSVPAKVAAIVMASKSLQETQTIISTEIHQALDELSRTDIDSGAIRRPDADETPGDDYVATAQAPKPKPVGRRTPVHPSRRKSNRTRKVANVEG